MICRYFFLTARGGRGKHCLSLFCLFILSFRFFSPPATAQQDPGSLDVRAFRSINDARSPFLDDFVDSHDRIAPALFVLVPVAFTGYGFLSKSKFEEDTGFSMGAAELGTFIVSTALKIAVDRKRPWQSLRDVKGPDATAEVGRSFPSNHSSLSFAIATTLSYRYPKPYVYIPAFLWAALVGYGRIYLGVHYPSDVLAGAAIGIGATVILHHWEDDLIRLKDRVFRKVGVSSLRFGVLPAGDSMFWLQAAF